MESTDILMPTVRKLRFLLLFDDDSTLMGASRIAPHLERLGHDVNLVQIVNPKDDAESLSKRQLEQWLPGGEPDLRLTSKALVSEEFLTNFDAIICTKFPRAILEKFVEKTWKFNRPRPAFVAMYAGIDFEPIIGFKNRRFYDLICLNSTGHLKSWEEYSSEFQCGAFRSLILNPYFIETTNPANTRLERLPEQAAIVFLTQSEVPSTLTGRLSVLQLFYNVAKRHPKNRFVIKLRHLETENSSHKHKEIFSYQRLTKKYFGDTVPDNVSFTDESMQSVLEVGDAFISCTSTGVIEAVANGKLGVFLSEWEQRDKDLHAVKAAEIFATSGLMHSAEDLLKLDIRRPVKEFERSWIHSAKIVEDLCSNIFEFRHLQEESESDYQSRDTLLPQESSQPSIIKQNEMPLHIALLFNDDSTLMGAARLSKHFAMLGHNVCLVHISDPTDKDTMLSQRQLNQSLPSTVIHCRLPAKKAASEAFLMNFDAVMCTKYPKEFILRFNKGNWSFKGVRPAFVALYAGLDFTPEIGFNNRRFFDVLCFNSSEHLEQWKSWVPSKRGRKQKALILNPYFIANFSQPARGESKISDTATIVFLAQSEVPSTFLGRMYILRTLSQLAELHPQHRVVIKLRHLEGENTQHKHKEIFSYQWLSTTYLSEHLPANLEFVDDSMPETLVFGDVFISCTSTGVIEAIANGKIGAFLNDWPQRELETHAGKSSEMFEAINLMHSIDDILNLRFKEQSELFYQSWIHDPGQLKSLCEMVRKFKDAQSGSAPAAMVTPSFFELMSRRVKWIWNVVSKKVSG